VRIQFGKDATSLEVLKAINKIQDDWAKAHPEKAHKLHPTKYAEDGSVIRQTEK
jgi:hypothetical protein